MLLFELLNVIKKAEQAKCQTKSDAEKNNQQQSIFFFVLEKLNSLVNNKIDHHTSSTSRTILAIAWRKLGKYIILSSITSDGLKSMEEKCKMKHGNKFLMKELIIIPAARNLVQQELIAVIFTFLLTENQRCSTLLFPCNPSLLLLRVPLLVCHYGLL